MLICEQGREDDVNVSQHTNVQTTFRGGAIDRVESSSTAIVKDMFKKETDLKIFLGQPLLRHDGSKGTITAAFGSTGRVRAEFVLPEGAAPLQPGEKVALVRRKYLYK